MTSFQLEALANAQVFPKCENFQRGGTFKFRGAYHTIARSMSSRPAHVVATFSSANYAQGLALACRLQGAAAHVVMPKSFSAIHKGSCGSGFFYGGQVHGVEDRNCTDARCATSWVTIRRWWSPV